MDSDSGKPCDVLPPRKSSAATSRLARGSRSALPRSTPFRARGFRAPLHPTTKGRPCPLDPRPDTLPRWTGSVVPCPRATPRQAFAPDTTTQRGLAPLDTRAGASAPRHPRPTPCRVELARKPRPGRRARPVRRARPGFSTSSQSLADWTPLCSGRRHE